MAEHLQQAGKPLEHCVWAGTGRRAGELGCHETGLQRQADPHGPAGMVGNLMQDLKRGGKVDSDNNNNN